MRLIAATTVLVAGLATPAAAAVKLDRIKPCYASDGVREEQRETIRVRATGFTPAADVVLKLDNNVVATGRADIDGIAEASIAAPFHGRGQRPFTLVVEEVDNPFNAGSTASLVTNLTVNLRPKRARPSRRVRFRGRGFTRDAPVWAHYLYGGELIKTVRLARRPNGQCGTFSVKRRQIPVRDARTGEWLLQVDQQRAYAERPLSNMQRILITVRETFLDPG
jgi:hypothetical protein